MTEQIFTPNELIYLLLDGEASPMQRDQVFQALAHDSNLQHEFDSALKLNNAFEQELKSSKPAAALMGSLFQKAGMTTLGVGGGAAISTAIKTGWFAGLAKVVVPVAAALLGSGITYMAVSSNSTAPALTEQTGNMTHKTDATNGTNTTISSYDHTTIRPYDHPTQRVKYIVVHDTVQMKNNEVAQTTKEAENIAIPPTTVVVEEKNVSKVEARLETPKAIDVDLRSDHSLQSLTPVREVKKVFITLRGTTALRVYPDRDITSSQNNVLSNLSAGIMYEFAPNHSLGLEAGVETFPITVINSNGSAEKKFNLLWGGMSYRYTMDRIWAIGGLQPFAQIVFGGTMSGPIGKLAMGLTWQPDDKVILMLGAEGMMQTYQYHNTWGHGEKLGITSGVAIRF